MLVGYIMKTNESREIRVTDTLSIGACDYLRSCLYILYTATFYYGPLILQIYSNNNHHVTIYFIAAEGFKTQQSVGNIMEIKR